MCISSTIFDPQSNEGRTRQTNTSLIFKMYKQFRNILRNRFKKRRLEKSLGIFFILLWLKVDKNTLFIWTVNLNI